MTFGVKPPTGEGEIFLRGAGASFLCKDYSLFQIRGN
jgi:hypothetical protein